MNNDFQQQGTQPPQAAPIPQATPMPTAPQEAPIPQATPMPTAQQTAVPPPPAQFNPNFQNQFGGGGPKPLPKGLLKIIGISAAALVLIVGIIITVLIVTDPGYELDGDGIVTKPGYELDGTVIVKVNKDWREIVIREGVTGIDKGAFAHCDRLERITIPASLKYIYPGEFSDCVRLKKITVFSLGCSKFRNIEKAFPGDYNGELHIVIPEGATEIYEEAFSKCKAITSVSIPDSVTYIGVRAFDWCTSLTSITIPDRVTTIQAEAFWGCKNLTSVTIPDSVTSIGDGAFWFCDLKSVSIPKNCEAKFGFGQNCSVIRRD